MKNNVYVRSNRSIFTISITRIIFLLPLIMYGIYKNGIHLYIENYINLANLFKPVLLIVGSALVGAIVNIVYEKLIKKSKDTLIDILFSSFHIEYGIVLACLMPININLIIYFGVLTLIFFVSKFLNNRVNTMCVCFILIFTLSYLLNNSFIYANSYELDKTFSLEFMDYLIGKGVGGIASTNILLLIIAIIGMYLTSNNKTSITLSAIITFIIVTAAFAIIKDISFVELLFKNNLLFIYTYVITDSVTSCYTTKGKQVFGIISVILAFLISFINPILAPFISILIVSLFNNLLDRTVNKIFKNN